MKKKNQSGKNNQPNYENWVPVKMLYCLSAAVLIALALLALAINYTDGWLWTTLTALLSFFTLFLWVYMYLCRRKLSFSKGGLMGRVHEYLLDHLQWDGQGTLLDVGCGAGALTIRCAKKYPKARCTGIDYWGIAWDYSQEKCIRNAEIEQVADRCTFQKGDANHLDFADETFDVVVSNFVYHEVSGSQSKEDLLRETLRVLKKGGYFALQDIFGQRSMYGDFHTIIGNLRADMVSEIHYATDATSKIPIPVWMRIPGMITGVGVIYGRK